GDYGLARAGRIAGWCRRVSKGVRHASNRAASERARAFCARPFRPERPRDESPGLSAAMRCVGAWREYSRPERAQETNDLPETLAPFRAHFLDRLASQGIASLSLGLYSHGLSGRTPNPLLR